MNQTTENIEQITKNNKTKNLLSVSGQTMLEVVIALTLIILFLSGVVIVELFAIKNVQYAQNKSTAAKLARQQLERARVVRDSAGIGALYDNCQLGCYINSYLTPQPPALAPTGMFTQALIVQGSSDCPLPAITVTPLPVNYKATAVVSWQQSANLTPIPPVQLSTCITDWR